MTGINGRRPAGVRNIRKKVLVRLLLLGIFFTVNTTVITGFGVSPAKPPSASAYSTAEVKQPATHVALQEQALSPAIAPGVAQESRWYGLPERDPFNPPLEEYLTEAPGDNADREIQSGKASTPQDYSQADGIPYLVAIYSVNGSCHAYFNYRGGTYDAREGDTVEEYRVAAIDQASGRVKLSTGDREISLTCPAKSK